MVAPIPVIGFMIAGALISKTVDVAIPYIAEQAKGWRWGWAREPQIPAYLRGKVNTVVGKKTSLYLSAFELLTE